MGKDIEDYVTQTKFCRVEFCQLVLELASAS